MQVTLCFTQIGVPYLPLEAYNVFCLFVEKHCACVFPTVKRGICAYVQGFCYPFAMIVEVIYLAGFAVFAKQIIRRGALRAVYPLLERAYKLVWNGYKLLFVVLGVGGSHEDTLLQ